VLLHGAAPLDRGLRPPSGSPRKRALAEMQKLRFDEEPDHRLRADDSRHSQEGSSMPLRLVKQIARNILSRTDSGSRWLWNRQHNATAPAGTPEAPWWNAVLLSKADVDAAVEQLTRLRLPPMRDYPKNWDSLAALDLILRKTDRSARVLDAGSERYSMILPWLAMYGYRHLRGCNLVFDKPSRMGPIRYEYGDITATSYGNATFDAVTCLSVVEHGVNMEAYFREMSRIIRPGGVLITSTDYWEMPVETFGRRGYGVPIHIFDKAEILELFAIAARCGFELLSPVNLSSREKVVWWVQHDLSYTFLLFSMVRHA
jgi:SAM-dependent methyltransferase